MTPRIQHLIVEVHTLNGKRYIRIEVPQPIIHLTRDQTLGLVDTLVRAADAIVLGDAEDDKD